ncbi:MAG TPA: hypothetical protein PLZ86_05700 [bacterium]|nr:hypothetical protein [bacterium]
MQITDPDDLKRIKAYIDAVEWRFAKTMPEIPHYYTVLSWRPDLQDDFFHFVNYIHTHGYMAEFEGKDYKYLNVDGHKYWTMDWPLEETTLINRAEIVTEPS